MSEVPDAFAQTYGVDLLFEAPPSITAADLVRAIQVTCPAAQPGDPSSQVGSLAVVVHPDRASLKGGDTVAPQTVVFPVSHRSEADAESEKIESDDLGQSWSFPGVRDVVARCQYRMRVTDMSASHLPYRQRLELFQDVLAGILQAAPATAIHWQPTGQFIAPTRFLEASREGGAVRFFAGALNVRFYNVSNSPGDMIMDTLGLAAIGLPDLQCHYHDIDPPAVVAVLSNLAYYLYEQGNVIKDGHLVGGEPPGSRWRCDLVKSILHPSRMVLDLDPGPRNAAGNRTREA